MRRRRWRTAVLWGGCTLCVLILAAFVASGWRLLAIQVPTQYGPAVAVNAGMLGIILDDQWSVVFVAERRISRPGPFFTPTPTWAGWAVWDVGRRYVSVPLYAMFLAVAVPTLLVRRFVPKYPPGHCPCGYDLRGNVSGTCPECGRETGDAA